MQRMQAEPGQVHALRIGRLIQRGQDSPNPLGILWRYAPSLTSRMEPTEPVVTEIQYHVEDAGIALDCRPLLVPLRGLLVGVGDVQQAALRQVRPD